MKSKSMDPIEIKSELEKAGYTQVRIADECSVSQPFVHQVINNTSKSHRVRTAIAKAIGRKVDEVWEVKENPSKVGRPLTRLNHQAA